MMKNNDFQKELRIYLDLIRYGPKTISELELIYDESIEELRESIIKLEKMGLVRKTDSLYIPTPQLKLFLDKIGEDVISLKKNIDRVLTNINNLKNRLTNLPNEIRLRSQQLAKKYYNIINREIEKINSKIISSLRDNLEIIKTTISKTINDLDTLHIDLQKYSESMESNISELDLLKEMILKKTINEIKERLSITIAELLLTLKRDISGLDEHLNSFKEITSTELGKLLNISHMYYSSISDNINNVKGNIVNLINSQKNDIDETLSLISQELKQQTDALIEKVHLLNKEISKFLSTFLSDLKEGMERFNSNAKRRIIALKDSLVSILDANINNYAEKIQLQINSTKDSFTRALNNIQVYFDTNRKGMSENLSKSALKIKNKIAAILTKTIEDVANNNNKINEVISQKLMSINSLFSEIFEQSVNTLLEITKSYEEIIIQELESLYREILIERKEILEKIDKNLVNLSEKIISLHSLLEEYEINMEREATSKLSAHLDEITGKIDNLIQDYSLKMEREIRNFSQKIVNEISRIIAKTLLKSKKEKESLLRDIKEISDELDDLGNLIKKLETDTCGKESESLSELINRFNSIKKKAKRMTLNIERSGRVGEDELVKIKENVVALMDDAAERYVKELLSTLLISITTTLKNYLNARVEELIKIYGERLKDLKEKFKMEFDWITAAISNLSSELKSEIERGDQAIFGIFDAISRRSIGIGRKVISERESEVELLQKNVRRELSLMSKEISEIMKQNTAIITSKFNKMSQDISSIIDDASKDIESALNNLIDGALSKLDISQQEALVSLDEIMKLLRGALDEFNRIITNEINQIIEKTNELLKRYYQTFESKTIKSLESAKSNIDLVIENIISTIDTSVGLINNKLIETLSKLVSETDNYIQLVSNDFNSLLKQIDKQYAEKKETINEIKNNLLNKVASISSNIEKLLINLDNYHKDETNWFKREYVNVIESAILEVYNSVKNMISLTRSNLKDMQNRINELLNTIKTSENKCSEHYNTIKESINVVLNTVRNEIKEKLDELAKNMANNVYSQIEEIDEIKHIREIYDEKSISGIMDRIESNYERVLNLDELLSESLGNYIEKARITIGKKSLKTYLYSALKSAKYFALIILPEKIDFKDEELSFKPDTHIEIIAPQRILSNLRNINENKLFLRTAKKMFNFALIIRDNEEALLSIKRADTWVNYLFKEKNIIDNLRELITKIL